MPGPWERYAAPAQGPAQGPWSRYAQPAQPEERGLGERAGQAVLNAIPGRGTYEAFSGGRPWEEKASAIGGDVANAAMLGAAGLGAGLGGIAKVAGAGAGLNLANDYLQDVNRKSGEVGGKLADMLAGSPKKDTPSVLRNFLAQVPQAIGETAGEFAPSAALLALGGKLPGAMRGRAAAMGAGNAEAAAARTAAQELAAKGYPATESHAVPGDVRLKQALANPALSAERDAYMAKLSQAQRADLESTLQPARLQEGPQATATLGGRFQKAASGALKERDTTYGRMMDLVSQAEKGVGEVTGIGQRTHAGELFNRRMEADLKRRGVDLNKIVDPANNLTLRDKALLPGSKLTQYDVPPGMNAADVQATIKFGDVAKQQAPRPADLAPLASNFAKTEGLFQSGGSPSALQQRANRTAVTVSRETIAKADKASGNAYPARLPVWERERANWAQGADLAGEQGKYQPRIDALGNEIRSEMTSPELVFRNDVITGGAQRVRQWKDFLGKNGQDPAILEHMALDHLDEMAGGASGNVTAASLKSAWQKLAGGKNAELGAELFSPQTAAKVEQVIQRMEQAERPLTVMGTPSRGGSPTSPLQRIGKLGREFGPSAVGLGVGGALGGPGGAALGAVAGEGLKRVGTGMQRSFMERPPSSAMPGARRAAALQKMAGLIEALKSGQRGVLPAQAALAAGRSSR